MTEQPLYADLAVELKWWQEIAPTLDWWWSTTMSHNYPHRYVVKGKTCDPEVYERLFRLIMARGEPAKFYDRVNIELACPTLEFPFWPAHTHGTVHEWEGLAPQPPRTAVTRGMKFWPMTDKLSESTVINCAPLSHLYGEQDAPATRSNHPVIYDAMASVYDERYDTPTAHAEDATMWKHIAGDRAIPDLLDLGAGTGLALDMKLLAHQTSRPDSAGRYRAVDPSQGMLNRLVYKHQWVKDICPITAEEYLLDPVSVAHRPHGWDAGRRFDTVVSLFGAASYIRPEAIQLMPTTAERQLILMHYLPDYAPDYLTDPPAWMEESRKAAANLPHAEVRTLNHFQVTTVRRDQRGQR